MGLFERLLHPKKEARTSKQADDFNTKEEVSHWQNILGYIPASLDEHQLVSLITAAIAAGEQSESSFVLKGVSKRNPEAALVAVIASSIVAADQPESQFVIKSIKEKNL
ncbi:hypothetical protein [Enterococcus rivorum]|uniref:Uncharacterized protein n=1 Tax=Enterococcus rivorum TaxID=762845 RepID=A0A1E5L0A7_9ENTE|nr:hypothetical protein [Enterococcus rivorum]MBP2099160.1 hypothetical protein [Enterococcus rivorum]OEH83513.1 hypothetical protein BCR26_09415 [Enterococcus rivorum]